MPPGDVAALAERLVGVLQDTPRREAIGAAARRSVEANFAWPRAVQATVDVYREVLGCR